MKFKTIDMIEVMEIRFKENTTLIMLASEYTDILHLSKELAFDIGDWNGNKRKTIRVEDYPENEWN